MKKIVSYTLILLAVFLGIFFAVNANKTRDSLKSSVTPPSPIATRTQKIRAEVPHRIVISSASVDAKVESVGKDSLGRMDVPKDFNNTAWYSLGTRPGDLGSAVIDGHVDTPTGDPSVFWQIDDLKQGDLISVYDKGGNKKDFMVKKVVSYQVQDMPLDKIFNDNNGRYLNLITCGGIWDKIRREYSERIVVYSELTQ